MAGFARALGGFAKALGEGMQKQAILDGEAKRQMALERLRHGNNLELEGVRSNNQRAEARERIELEGEKQIKVDKARVAGDIQVEGVRQAGALKLEGLRSSNQIKETAARVGMEEGAEIRKEDRQRRGMGDPKEQRQRMDDEAKRFRETVVSKHTTSTYDEKTGKNVEGTNHRAVEAELRRAGRDSQGYVFAPLPNDPSKAKVGYVYMNPKGALVKITPKGPVIVPNIED